VKVLLSQKRMEDKPTEKLRLEQRQLILYTGTHTNFHYDSD